MGLRHIMLNSSDCISTSIITASQRSPLLYNLSPIVYWQPAKSNLALASGPKNELPAAWALPVRHARCSAARTLAAVGRKAEQMTVLGVFWTVVGAGGRNLGRGRYRKMRLVQTKRMSLLARRSNPKWRNARVTNTQKERKKERNKQRKKNYRRICK